MPQADTPLPDLQAIRAARSRIRGQLDPTPLVRAVDLEDEVPGPLWLKAENLQRTGSFKARGALNWIETASPQELRNGLITVSAGNHALALAWAAAQRDVPLRVVMPEGASPMKVERTRALGAEVILHGDINAAVALCQQLREEHDLTLVHPYNDPRVMAGQGTVGLELVEQMSGVSRVLCPVGGGGLICGIGLVLKALKPEVRLIGVEPAGAATLGNAWDREDPDARLPRVDTIAASLAPAVVGPNTYAVSRQVVDAMVTVGEAAIRRATLSLLTRGHLYAETGAAVGLAALMEGAVPAQCEGGSLLVVTGGNMDPEQFCGLLAQDRP